MSCILSRVLSLIVRRPLISTRTDTLFPYTPLFRSTEVGVDQALAMARLVLDTVKQHPQRAILFLLDTRGQRLRKRDELLGLNGYMAHLAKCRSEEHTSELQSLMRISYAVFCLKKKQNTAKKHVHYVYTHTILI